MAEVSNAPGPRDQRVGSALRLVVAFRGGVAVVVIGLGFLQIVTKGPIVFAAVTRWERRLALDALVPGSISKSCQD